MEVTVGKDGRSHFRLDVEKQAIEVVIKKQGNKSMRGLLKDVSDGGIAFRLKEAPSFNLNDEQVLVSFQIEERIFEFDMRILRKFFENNTPYYAGKFLVTSKIKQSQLSLLLMKLKLIAKQ